MFPSAFSGPRIRTLVLVLCSLHLASGCKRGPSEPSVTPVQRAPNGSEDASREVGPRGDSGVFLTRVKAGALGPRLVHSRKGTVVVWGDVLAEEPRLHALAMGRDGAPFPPREVARIDSTARQLTLGWTNKGEVLATTVHKSAGQDVLTATRLSFQGVLEAGPQVLATTPNTILYTRVLQTALGAVVVWVERANGAADLYSIVIDEKGPRRATRQVRGITAWQVVGREGGSIAIVTREGTDTPSIMFRHLGARGETIGVPIELARDIVGGYDLDLAVGRNHILVAYSAGGAYHSQLQGILLDASGNVVRPPFLLTAPRGDQALLSVQGDEESDLFHLAWREPLEAHHGLPSVFVAPFASDASTALPRYRLNAARRDPLLPTFASRGAALAVLTDFPCLSETDHCSSGIGRASFLLPESGGTPQGGVLQVDAGSPTMAWDLTCSGDRCLYLLSDQNNPARIYLRTLDSKDALPEHVAEATDTRLPRLLSHETLAEIPELAELNGAVREDGTPLLAWVSYFQPDLPYTTPSAPAPDGRMAPVRARLTTVEPPDKEGRGGDETIISYRARSLGGVHLIAPQNNRGVLLWSALDQKQPQLFATLLDARGKKVGQRMLTKTDGEVTDVVGVRVDGGYLLSWIDGTGESPRVLALHISDALVPAGSARVVSGRAASPSGVTLLSTPHGVRCVWSDARDAGQNNAQLFGTLLDPKTGAPQEPEVQLTEGAGSAHSPRFASDSAGESILGWISQDAAESWASLHVASLEKTGALSRAQAQWSTEGDVRDFAIQCAAEAKCRAVVVVAEGEEDEAPRISLWALAGLSPRTTHHRENLVLPLWSPSAVGVSPVLLGEEIYFSDRAEDGSGWRLRRATIDWTLP